MGESMSPILHTNRSPFATQACDRTQTHRGKPSRFQTTILLNVSWTVRGIAAVGTVQPSSHPTLQGCVAPPTQNAGLVLPLGRDVGGVELAVPGALMRRSHTSHGGWGEQIQMQRCCTEKHSFPPDRLQHLQAIVSTAFWIRNKCCPKPDLNPAFSFFAEAPVSMDEAMCAYLRQQARRLQS